MLATIRKWIAWLLAWLRSFFQPEPIQGEPVMSALSIQPTYPIFTDIDGQPLEDGYVWIGTANLDPQTNPINVYWDAALTLPAAQPIRTLAGYPSNSGTPARLYVNSDYSIRVMNKNGSAVYSAPAATERYNESVITSIDSANVNFLAAGAGAVVRSAQSKMRDVVSILDFNNAAAIAGDWTTALQAAIDSLPLLGGVVYFPGEGPYTCASGVTTDKNLILRGDGKQTTILKYTGNATFIEQTSGDVLAFEEIIIAGDGTTAGPIAQIGSIAYKANNNSYSLNADFIFWYTVSEWQGGYYHKHFNSFFRYSKFLFNGYDQNNLAFFGCALSNFERGIQVVSGEGPITFVGGSIEMFADKAITSASGRAVCANLIGTYVEQGPATACPSGITSSTGFYDNGTVIYTNGTEVYPCSFIGCTVFTPGIFRMFWTDSAGGCNITGQGNNFISRGGTPLGTIYSLGGTKVRAYLNDTVVGVLPGGLAGYVSGLPTDLEGCTVYDPVNGQWLRPTTQGWTNLSLQNGFTNEGAPFANASYFQNKDGIVFLRGVVDGLAATDVTIANLPVGFRPTNVLNFSVPSVAAPGSTLQLSVYPSGGIILTGTAPFADQIGLDGVSFYVNS